MFRYMYTYQGQKRQTINFINQKKTIIMSGLNTKTVAKIRLEQLNVSKTIERLAIVNLEYTIKKCNSIDIDKLTQSITKAVYRRNEAEKNGLKLGFKASKPLLLTVTMNDKYIINTDNLASTTGTNAKIKINSSLLAKDEAKEKKRFQDVLKFIIDENETLNKEFKTAFFNPDKKDNKPQTTDNDNEQE